jgi:hypothetical protein
MNGLRVHTNVSTAPQPRHDRAGRTSRRPGGPTPTGVRPARSTAVSETSGNTNKREKTVPSCPHPCAGMPQRRAAVHTDPDRCSAAAAAQSRQHAAAAHDSHRPQRTCSSSNSSAVSRIWNSNARGAASRASAAAAAAEDARPLGELYDGGVPADGDAPAAAGAGPRTCGRRREAGTRQAAGRDRTSCR